MLKVRCFKTTGDHRPFLSKFDVKLLGYDSHKRTQAFRSFDQALTAPSGVQRSIYTTSAKREFDGMGLDGVGWGQGARTVDSLR